MLEAKRLDSKKLYRAVKARDPKQDGRFFTGVTTTGVFCRPVCPARTPKPENCSFFTTASEALAAGFRPCQRCRPTSAPGSPAWVGTKSTVARAMRLIAQGALDRETLPALCDRLGVGERHLRRLFATHIGATPAALANARRILVAKRSIEETQAPLAEIAFSSGFRSLRAFNTALAKACGKPPRDVRRSKKSKLPDSAEIAVVRAWMSPARH